MGPAATVGLSALLGLPWRGPLGGETGGAGAMVLSGGRGEAMVGPCSGGEEGTGTAASRRTYQEAKTSVASMSAPASATARLARFTSERERAAATAAPGGGTLASGRAWSLSTSAWILCGPSPRPAWWR